MLHLPLRYEDHTRLVPLAALQTGVEQQAEGTVVNTDVQYRPRRQLVCLLEDGDDEPRRAGAARAALLPLLSEPAEGARPRPARARVRRSARRPLRARDRASAVQGGRAGDAAAGPAHARLPDDRGARPGDAAQGDRARARVRSGAHRRIAARLGRRARSTCGSSPTRCSFCTRRRRGCRGSRSRRSTCARIRPGRASSSTSSSRSSCRSRRTARRAPRVARRC